MKGIMNRLAALVGVCAATVAGVVRADAYDPSTQITGLGDTVSELVTTAAGVFVVVIGIALGIAALWWVFGKTRAKLFGR